MLQEEDKGDILQKLKAEITCHKEAASNSPALPVAMLEDSSSGCGGGVAGRPGGRATEGQGSKEGRADKEDASSSKQQQVAWPCFFAHFFVLSVIWSFVAGMVDGAM